MRKLNPIVPKQDDGLPQLSGRLAIPQIDTSADHGECDVYLAYSGATQLQAAGFLVTARGNADRLIAFVPLTPDTPGHGRKLTAELERQYAVALRIAREPHTADGAQDAICLTHGGLSGHPVPHWIFGLSCVSMADHWNGNFVHPRPFCPQMFEAMASQPSAMDWLKGRHEAQSA